MLCGGSCRDGGGCGGGGGGVVVVGSGGDCLRNGGSYKRLRSPKRSVKKNKAADTPIFSINEKNNFLLF